MEYDPRGQYGHLSGDQGTTGTEPPERRRGSGWGVILAIAALVAVIIFVTARWQDAKRDQQMDDLSDEFIEQLCPPSDPC